jgi:hypothetical protein
MSRVSGQLNEALVIASGLDTSSALSVLRGAMTRAAESLDEAIARML